MPLAKQVVLFLIDGLRPDALPCAVTPQIDKLVSQGAHAWRVQTITPSITLPCHASLFQPVPPDRHGILENHWTPREPCVSSIMEVVHQAGLGTAAFHTWGKIHNLASFRVLDALFYQRIEDPEAIQGLETHAVAASYIVEHRPAFTFVFSGAVDQVGHRHGWMSAAYLRAVGRADRNVGRVLDALHASGASEDTICFVLADHGGHDTDHKYGLPDDLTIPWIISGPGIRHGHEISVAVSIMDTAPTIAHLLGVAVPTEWHGQVVTDVLVS